MRRHPEEGVHVYGLFIEGCRWDKSINKLADADPKVLIAPMPVILISGQLATEPTKLGQLYTAPCYKNPNRTSRNFIFGMPKPWR